MSVLVLTPEEAILLDAGTGISRLQEPSTAELLEPYERLHLILSHYHLDHTAGLAYLPLVWAERPVHIYAPGHPITEVSPAEALDRLLSPPLFPVKPAGFPFEVEINPVTGDSLQIGNLPVAVRAQNHPGGSMGIRLADSVAYITDTTVDDAIAGFARGVSLLLHELWLTDREAEENETERARHSCVSGVARIVKEANPGMFMPVHHHPARSRAGVHHMAHEVAALAGVKTTVPQESETYPVD
jgi:ribonuclease BN (tRNA processing enzyme)